MFEAIITAYRWFFLRLAGSVGLGWGIVVLSVICSALMIPLMRLVAGVVKRETDYQSVILPQVADIKMRYAGDMERHAATQRLYRRYGYSPLSAVKKVLPLFVQIPFLLLTYFMLRDTAELRGVPFLFLRDLGRPDGLLAAFGVNVLPLVMTGVNMLTVFATPGFARRDWTQAISISILFLVMLYTAPSALLLYWTLNNVITLLRTLAGHRGEGSRLLARRILNLRNLPVWIRSKATRRNVALVGLIALPVALYMRLMVYMQVWFFNRMASYWLMNEVLAVALLAQAILRRREGRVVAACSWLGAFASAVVALLVVSALALLPVTPKGMMFVNASCNLSSIFDGLFLFGLVPVVIDGIVNSRETFRSLVRGFAANGYWLTGIVILSIHYSFASQNFKLPLDAVALLTGYMLLPAVAVCVLMHLEYRRHFEVDWLFKVGMGIVLGAYLIPMVSLEEGKLLGYGSNLLVRFVLMGIAAFAICRIRRRKPALVFLSLLMALVVFNAVRSSRCQADESGSQVEATAVAEARQSLLNAPCVHSNSVYLLVYDGYMHDTVLEGMNVKSLGIGDYLKKRGFTSYDAYSVGSDTVASMGNAFYIGGVAQGSVRSSMVGNNVFCDYLRRFGYKSSYILCGYDMPNRGERMPGDFYFPSAKKITRPEMVLYPCIVRGILSQSANTFNAYTRGEWLAVKRDILKTAGATGSFIYAHSDKPGHVTANPIYRKSPEEERLAYERRVADADAELQEDIDLLLSKNDDSIIIVASDHGSHLSLPAHENEYDAFTMLDRVGIQLHVRWPRDYKPCLKLDCLQNLFLEVEIYLSGDNSLARFELPGESLRIMAPLRAPAGTINRSVIQSGPDKGRNLFTAARERVKKMTRVTN